MGVYRVRGCHRMMKRIARAVRRGCPTDAIAMSKETSFASGMEKEMITTHVILIRVSELVVVRRGHRNNKTQAWFVTPFLAARLTVVLFCAVCFVP